MAKLDNLLVERAAGIKLLALDVDGVLTDGQLYFDNQGNELKAFYTRDGMGLKAVQRAGIELALITGRESNIVANRAASLGIQHVYQGSDAKLDAYLDLLQKTGCEDAEVCYAGDDWIDLPLLKRVGLAVTVPAADEYVKAEAHFVTHSEGGHGAVRELCELLLTAQGAMEPMLQELLK